MNNEFKQASWDGCKFFLCTQTDFEKPGSWLQVINKSKIFSWKRGQKI